MSDIHYRATKTASEFHSDNSFLKMLFGPVGSGKSVTCCTDLMKDAMNQESSNDGFRYSRYAVIRNSYRQLKTTTLKTWLDWFPENSFGSVVGNSPIFHKIKFNDVDCEVIFMPIESEKDIDNLKSLELTKAYVNEIQYTPKSVLDACLERVNRYPSKKSGASPTRPGVICDTNPPTTRHWIYKLEQNLPENHKIFHYEPAVIRVDKIPHDIRYSISLDGTIYINNPSADYINNLPDSNYYLNLISGLSDEQVKVSCCGGYGFTRAGKPVHEDYNDLIHFVNQSIPYDPSRELVLGWDFGLTPACPVLQQQADGKIAMIVEYTSERSGIERFAKDVVIPSLNARCPGWMSNYKSFADPAGLQGNQVTYDNKSCITALNQLGIRTAPASTQNPDLRRGALSHFLRQINGGKGAFILSKDCQIAREGLMGDFQYENQLLSSTEVITKPKPLKNFSSHICEALEYAMLYFKAMASRDFNNLDISGDRIY